MANIDIIQHFIVGFVAYSGLRFLCISKFNAILVILLIACGKEVYDNTILIVPNYPEYVKDIFMTLLGGYVGLKVVK